jgi:hypothetical protein
MRGYDPDYDRFFPQRGLDRDTRPPGVARYPGDPEYRRRSSGRVPRVTARYNLDYVVPGREDEYERNYAPYGESRRVPTVEPDAYVKRYLTRGGTETYRGADRPFGWERGRGDSPREGHGSSRPRVGGYRRGYQGGSGGIETGEGGADRERGYDRGYRARPRYDAGYRRR